MPAAFDGTPSPDLRTDGDHDRLNTATSGRPPRAHENVRTIC
jgi:hypothetical protein